MQHPFRKAGSICKCYSGRVSSLLHCKKMTGRSLYRTDLAQPIRRSATIKPHHLKNRGEIAGYLFTLQR